MTRESTISLPIVTSADGTRCMEACPQMSGAWPWTCSHWWDPITGAATLDDVDVDAGTARRPPACIAAEQAAASVPSCEGAKHVESLATLATNAENNLAYIHATFPGGDPRDMDWYAGEVAALAWAHKAAQAAASAGHLDGGARSLDASEALREARVQGMREGYNIRRSGAALVHLNAAIKAVRKGER